MIFIQKGGSSMSRKCLDIIQIIQSLQMNLMFDHFITDKEG